MDGDEKSGTAAPILGYSEMSVNFDVRPVVKYDPNLVSETNNSGKTFAGVEFSTNVTQYNVTSDNAPTKYEGYLSVNSNTTKYSARINSSCEGYSVPGSTCASIFIPINQIKPGSVSNATISLGNPNPNMLIGNKSFQKNYNLKTPDFDTIFYANL